MEDEDEVAIRSLHTLEEVFTASELFSAVWHGDRSGMAPNLLRALAHSGNYVVGMFAGEHMVGASAAFFAEPAARSMHSHITGVLPGCFRLWAGTVHEMCGAAAGCS